MSALFYISSYQAHMQYVWQQYNFNHATRNMKPPACLCGLEAEHDEGGK